MKETAARILGAKRRARVKTPKLAKEESWHFEVQGNFFDRREAEALRLEIWGLVRRYNVQVRGLRVESAD